MSGRLYALGVGPGASDLITVRAARLIAKLDVLYAPAGRKGGESSRGGGRTRGERLES